MKKKLLIGLFLSLGILAPRFSNAANFSPTTSAQLLADLVSAAANAEDDTITLAASTTYSAVDAGGTFIYSSITNNALTITGGGAGSTILDGGSALQVLSLANIGGGAFTISGLTVQNGSSATAGGGIIVSGSTISIQNCDFNHNTVTGNDGGAVSAIALTGNLTFSNNTVTQNTATGAGADAGGVILATIDAASILTVEGNTFSNNTAAVDFGGVYADSSGSTVFNNNILSTNSAVSSGGGRVRASSGTATVTGNTISTNSSTAGMTGGISVITMSTDSITFNNNTVQGNTATGSVGGILLAGVAGEISASSNTISGNSATAAGSDNGGILLSTAGNINFLNNTVSGNSAADDGGGAVLINVASGNNITTGNTFSTNTALDYGGILVVADEGLNFSNNLVLSNTATGNNGGGYLSNITSGGVQIVNNVIAANTAPSEYGGMIILDTATGAASTFSLLNNTVNGNATSGGVYAGLLVIASDSSITSNLYNNILFGNTNDGTTGQGKDLFITNASGMLNVFNNDVGEICFSTPASCDVTVLAAQASGNVVNVDPLFINVAAGNYRLQATSTLIDQGLLAAPGLPATDIAGNPRSFLTVPDIGAYEAVAEVLSSSTTIDFGSVATNNANTVVITLSNNGTYDLNVSALTLSDTTNFALQTNAGATPCGSSSFQIASGASCTLGVEFGPNTVAAFAESLTVTSDAPASPSYVIALTGTGVESSGGCALQSGVANSSALLLLLLPLALTATLRKRNH